MMKINFYKNNSPNNSINKNISLVVTRDINLRSNVDISNPVLRLSGVDFSTVDYVFIEGLGRYYFIDSIRSVNSKVVEVFLKCDVLESFKDEILSSNALYMRAIKTGDYFDGEIDKSSKKEVSSFSSNVELESGETILISTVGA